MIEGRRLSFIEKQDLFWVENYFLIVISENNIYTKKIKVINNIDFKMNPKD
jgi:hypothetical protein